MSESKKTPRAGLTERRHGHSHLRIRTFVLLLTVPLLLLLLGSCLFMLAEMHKILTNTSTARSTYLPAILENNRVAVNLEVMRRHVALIFLESSGEARRTARITAQTLGTKITLDPAPHVREVVSTLYSRLAVLEQQRSTAEQAKKQSVTDILVLESHLARLALDGKHIQDVLTRFQALSALDSLHSTDDATNLQNLSYTLAAMIDELSSVASEKAHEEVVAVRKAIEKTIDSHAQAQTYMQLARVTWLEVDAKLHTLRDQLNINAVDSTYTTLSSISEQTSRVMRAVYTMFFLVIVAFGFLIFMLHIFIVRPILVTSYKLQDIRTGQSSPPMSTLRIQELNEVSTLINISSEQIALLYRHARELEREKERIESMAITDGLTALYNRRYFDIQYSLLRESSLTTGKPLSVIMLDIDHFKLYNDSLGHSAGDECLRLVAKTIKSSLYRKTDMAFRYGGEEFVVLLPSCPASMANTLCERIRAHIEALGIVHPESPIAPVVTVSIGVATLTQAHPLDEKRLLDLADSAMYQAKAEGRNRVRAANNG